jgi:hypothetical protein
MPRITHPDGRSLQIRGPQVKSYVRAGWEVADDQAPPPPAKDPDPADELDVEDPNADELG